MPRPTSLNLQLRRIVELECGTSYAAGKAIAEATGEPLRTAIARVDRLTGDNPPEYLQKLEALVEALGYRIEISKR